MNKFFDAYHPYTDKLRAGYYPQAIADGVKFLIESKRFSPNEFEAAPKGTPFYFLAIAAFLSHDFQTATFLFDAAVSEDLRHHSANKRTPALLFMRLDDKNKKQAAFEIVRIVAARVSSSINSYNQRTGSKQITLPGVRRFFLNRVLASPKPELRTLMTAFISFFLEWDHRARLIELSEAGSREPFFMHLFKGCLLFESLLKENPSKAPTHSALGGILKYDLAVELGVPTTLKISAPSFDTIVRSLLLDQPIDAAIECTGKSRNTLGHNLAWTATSLDGAKYNLLAENIAVSCLHAISCLYR